MRLSMTRRLKPSLPARHRVQPEERDEIRHAIRHGLGEQEAVVSVTALRVGRTQGRDFKSSLQASN